MYILYIYAHIYIPYIISNITYYIMHVYIISSESRKPFIDQEKKKTWSRPEFESPEPS